MEVNRNLCNLRRALKYWIFQAWKASFSIRQSKRPQFPLFWNYRNLLLVNLQVESFFLSPYAALRIR